MNSLQVFNYNGSIIQRRDDGFISLTQMCQANGKRIDHWKELKATKAYIQELQSEYPESRVIESGRGGDGGTWGHPSLAINLARWISPKFAVWCDAHIFNLMATGQTSLDIDPIQEMQLRIELARLEAQKETAIAQAKQADLSLTQFRYTVTQTCPEPIQQKILGYQTVKEVEVIERVIDKATGEVSDGVGITYVAKSLGFKNTKACWEWLERVGYGKESGKWQDQLIAQYSPKLSRAELAELRSLLPESQRQLFLGE